jgi:hypothetical protein
MSVVLIGLQPRGGGAQDGTVTVGDAHPCRDVPSFVRTPGGGVTGSAPLSGSAACEGNEGWWRTGSDRVRQKVNETMRAA